MILNLYSQTGVDSKSSEIDSMELMELLLSLVSSEEDRVRHAPRSACRYRFLTYTLFFSEWGITLNGEEDRGEPIVFVDSLEGMELIVIFDRFVARLDPQMDDPDSEQSEGHL